MKVKIFGKNWNLKFVNYLGYAIGSCDHPDEKNKTIKIKKGLGAEEEISTIIHECLHASDWTKDETWIDEVSLDIGKILIKLGYRRNLDKKDRKTNINKVKNE